MLEHKTAPRPIFTPIAPYEGSVLAIDGQTDVIRLSVNESALGPSPRAVEAYRAAASSIHRYPDGDSGRLRSAIAASFDVARRRVVCGTGSDELIALLCRSYASHQDEILHSQYGYLMYAIQARAAGATAIACPAPQFATDLTALRSAVSPRTRIVFLANPNNPTGAYVSDQEVRAFHASLPPSVLLVIDAAYCEYVSNHDYDCGLQLARDAANVVVLRTFSKIYGLAGLRVGWGYASEEVTEVLNITRGPYNVSLAAEAAAVAALHDVEKLERARAHNEVWRPWLHRQLAALGFEVLPSVANFLAVKLGATPHEADQVFAFLCSHKILIRQLGAYGMPCWGRITVGDGVSNQSLIKALSLYVSANGNGLLEIA